MMKSFKTTSQILKIVTLSLALLIAWLVVGCAQQQQPESKEIRYARIKKGLEKLSQFARDNPKFARAFKQACTNQAWEETRYTVGGESRTPLYIGCDNAKTPEMDSQPEL